VCWQVKGPSGPPEGVTDASAPWAANDLDLANGIIDGARGGEIVDASTSAAVLPLSGNSRPTIRTLELNQGGCIDG
jgi:hypothetical protein